MFDIVLVLISGVCFFAGWRLGYAKGYERGQHSAACLFANKAIRSSIAG